MMWELDTNLGGGTIRSMQTTYVNKHGFTIVELLIVIVVVAILAAISIAAYTNVSNRAHDSTVQSDLRNFSQKLDVYRAEYGKYPANLTQLNAAMTGFSVTTGSYDTSYYTFTYVLAIDRQVYAIAAKSKSGTIWFRSSDDSGIANISSTYSPFVRGLIGMSDPPSEPSYGDYGYRLNTDTWRDWTK